MAQAVVFPEPWTPAIITTAGRPSREKGRCSPAQRDRELLVHDLHDLLAGREALHDLLGQRTVPHAREEVVGDLDGDVGLEQGRPHLTQGVVHLLGVELAS